MTSEAPDEATELATPADKTHPAGSSSTLPANRLEGARIADRVLCGETDALAALVSRYHRPMIRLAQRYVRDQATAEEVVQETWGAVLCGIARFQGRGSLRSCIYAILVNLARTRKKRDAGIVPFAASGHRQYGPPSVAPGLRCRSDDPPSSPWASGASTSRSAEQCVLDRELIEVVIREIAALPVSQRAVIYLRDVRGFAADDVCALLSISDGAQRVRLHRARHQVRAAIVAYLAVAARPSHAEPQPTNQRSDGSRPAAGS